MLEELLTKKTDKQNGRPRPEVDNRIRSRNTKDGIRRALKEGHYPYGMPPKGYSKDKLVF